QSCPIRLRGPVMLNVARILAVLSIGLTAACAVVAIGAGRFNLLHLGFEFVLVFGSLFFNLAALTGVLALLTTVVRVLLGAKDGNARVVQISVVFFASSRRCLRIHGAGLGPVFGQAFA